MIVIATARNAAGSTPENLKMMINMDCLVVCADAQDRSSLRVGNADEAIQCNQCFVCFWIASLRSQ
jgi:hypothetical protein